MSIFICCSSFCLSRSTCPHFGDIAWKCYAFSVESMSLCTSSLIFIYVFVFRGSHTFWSYLSNNPHSNVQSICVNRAEGKWLVSAVLAFVRIIVSNLEKVNNSSWMWIFSPIDKKWVYGVVQRRNKIIWAFRRTSHEHFVSRVQKSAGDRTEKQKWVDPVSPLNKKQWATCPGEYLGETIQCHHIHLEGKLPFWTSWKALTVSPCCLFKSKHLSSGR